MLCLNAFCYDWKSYAIISSLCNTVCRKCHVLQLLIAPRAVSILALWPEWRTHHTRMHGRRLQVDTKGSASRLHGLRVQDHCINQMPICKHCGCTLTTWHQFRVHVLSSCVVLHSAKTDKPALQSAAGPSSQELARQSAAGLLSESDHTQAQAPFEQPSVQRLLAAGDWKSILQLNNMKAVLQHHRVLCNQWVAKAPGSIALHVKAIHPDLMLHWDNAMAHTLTLREGHARPCQACGAAPRGRHRCRVLHQLCLVLHHWRALRLVSSASTAAADHGAHNAGGPGSCRYPEGSSGDNQSIGPGGRGNATHLSTGETRGAKIGGGPSQVLQAGWQGAGPGLDSDHPPESEPSRGSGQSSDQWQNRPANPRTWTKEQTRQRQDEMWRQWGSNTSWYQSQEVKKLRQEMEQLQEHVRLLARMSLRHEDELSQGRTERDFVLTFEPPNPGTSDNSTNMLVLLFRMAVVWKEKKEEGKVDSSLRLALFLGLIKQYIKQITTSLEQRRRTESSWP